jgi:hypothetical protein
MAAQWSVVSGRFTSTKHQSGKSSARREETALGNALEEVASVKSAGALEFLGDNARGATASAPIAKGTSIGRH